MPDDKYDHVLSCHDYNVMGETCPFYSGGECKMLGWGTSHPVPDDKICDKQDGELISKSTIVRFDLDPKYTEELQRLHKSDSYKRWREARQHYDLPPDERREAEFEILWTKARYKGQLSKRHFKKRFKPNNIGVTEQEDPSFRMRVLKYLRAGLSLGRPSKADLTERVAIIPRLERERYWDAQRGVEEVDEYWDIKVLTQYTSFEEELHMSGLDCWEGLEQLAVQYENQKILIEVGYYYSPGTYEYPNDVDFGIERVEVLKVLP